MSLEAFDSSLENQEFMAGALLGDVDESTLHTAKGDLDARRKLENKLEEMRLQKELREFDFDI